MADIRLFQLQSDSAREMRAESVDIEKSLQSLMEQHLESFLGVRFLATEYVTGKAHGGRIDTLGLDDNKCPVIIEYKRALNENVISQGLFYLDWLMDHQGEFTLQVLRKLGPEWAEKIDWSGPRLLCIAGDFTRYDEYAVLQIPRNIELLRYRRYGGDLLLLELVRASPTVPTQKRPLERGGEGKTDCCGNRRVWLRAKRHSGCLGIDESVSACARRRRADEGTGALRRVPAVEEFRLCQSAQQRYTGLDTTRSVRGDAGRGIYARCQSARPRRNRGSGNPDSNSRRSGARTAAPAAQLSRGLILSVAVFADSLVISALFELFAQPRSIGQRPQ